MNRRLQLLVFLLAALATAPSPDARQSPPTPPVPQSRADRQLPPVTFKVEVNYVEVDAVVVDQSGTFVRSLTKDDFQVFEDGARQTVSAFGLVDIPVCALLATGTRPDHPATGTRLGHPATGPRPGFGFFSNKAHSAGLRVSALITEKTTATAIVSAN